jgi:hypothetical protein
MKLRKLLLICGVLSSIVYVGYDVLAAIFHDAYHSFAAQTISELDARGAPTRSMTTPLVILYDLLVIGFGAGVWTAARGRRSLRVTAVMLVALGAVGLPGPWLFPMNLRGVGGDLPHIVATGVLVLLIITGMAFGAFAFGRGFRVYTLLSILTTLVFGTLTSVQAKGLVTGEPTPWIGLVERICVGAFLLWVVVLAVAVLREQEAAASGPSRARERIAHAPTQSAHA